LAKAKKAEKALSDAKKEHIQWEQAVTEWSTSSGNRP
jgi:hypothetical protein